MHLPPAASSFTPDAVKFAEVCRQPASQFVYIWGRYLLFVLLHHCTAMIRRTSTGLDILHHYSSLDVSRSTLSSSAAWSCSFAESRKKNLKIIVSWMILLCELRDFVNPWITFSEILTFFHGSLNYLFPFSNHVGWTWTANFRKSAGHARSLVGLWIIQSFAMI